LDIVGQGANPLGRGEVIFGLGDDWGTRPYDYQASSIVVWLEEGGAHYAWIQPLDSGIDYSEHLHP
jgi:hypothetical protein